MTSALINGAFLVKKTRHPICTISNAVGSKINSKYKSILVIEDDADIRSMITLALEIEGYSVLGTANGQEGLDLLQKIEGPCLILLDLMMPVMSGWEFLRAKREDDILAIIPVVIVSAFSNQAQGQHVEGILKKPVDLDALLRFVRQFCGDPNQTDKLC